MTCCPCTNTTAGRPCRGGRRPPTPASKADNKPFYVGEFGYDLDANPALTAEPWSVLAPEMVSKFNAYLAVPECAGAIYWDFKLEAQYAPDGGRTAAMTFGDAGWNAMATIKVPTPAVTTPPPPAGPATAANDNTTGVTDGHFAYSTGWTYLQANDPAKYKGDDHYTNVTGSTVTLHFKGTSAQIYGAKASWYGYGTFSVDGATAKNVDLYSATRADQVLVFNTGTLTAGEHTVTMTATGTHDANATDSYISIDCRRLAHQLNPLNHQQKENKGEPPGNRGFVCCLAIGSEGHNRPISALSALPLGVRFDPNAPR